MISMTEVLANHAALNPDKLFVIDQEGEITYGEAWSVIKKYASRLKNLDIKLGDYIIVECTQDKNFLLINYACQLIGAVFVPLERRAVASKVADIFDETGASLCISQTPYDIANVFSIDEFIKCDDIPELTDITFPAGDTVAEILYTTGTTGKSKGIEITHDNNYALAENIMYGVEMKTNNVELIPMPLSHSHGLRCSYANLLNGSTIVLTDGVSAIGYIFKIISEYGVTALDISPSIIMILKQLTKGKLTRFKDQIDYIQVGTAALLESEKEYLMTCFPDSRLYNFYGSTESGRSCVLDFNHAQKGPGCIGTTTKNATVIVVDDSGKKIISSPDNMGLLAFSGAMNMKGYFKHPELTKEIMYNGFVHTKDVGYIDEDGFVYMLGRNDDIINCNGIKIAPDEIEDAVRNMDMIEDCACVPQKDDISGQVPKLFIKINSNYKYDKVEFRKELSQLLDSSKMPREIVEIDEIPRSSNGKILRRQLI